MQPCCYVMIECSIQAVFVDDAGSEEPAETRRRLKGDFRPGATRRMTQLGMLVGSVVGRCALESEDAVVYATGFGETRALESYLDSFPYPSPTLFQTSIHPSGVQQGLIGRQFPVRELYPISGSRNLTAQALSAALVLPVDRVCLCGGEERGTWLLEKKAASDRSFAFALRLAKSDSAEPRLGTIALSPVDAEGEMPLEAFFNLVARRESFTGVAGPGIELRLSWL